MMEEASVQERETSEIIASQPELRALLLELWRNVRIDWSYASDQLSKTFRAQKGLASSARRAVAETLYAMIRNLRRIDFALGRAGRVTDRDRDALRVWATLILEFGLDPAAAEPSSTIDWTAVAGADDVIAATRKDAERIGIAASLPDWLAESLVEQYGADAEAIALALRDRAPMTVRVNTLKTTRAELAEALANDGYQTTPGAFSQTALHFETRTNIFGLPQFKAGLFEAQDEGSQLIADLVAPPPKGKVVDYCAGAGGKSLALAALLGNRGRIVAADVAHRKLAELRRRAKRAGAGNIAAVTLPDDPFEAMPKPIENWRRKADRVLVDAPCTGVGALRRNPEIRWRLQPGDPDKMAKLQLQILESAHELVADGGRLIYATCSILRTENQAVSEAFLAAHPEFELVPPKDIWGRETATPISDDTENTMELLPNRHKTDGFFAAVFRRRRKSV